MKKVLVTGGAGFIGVNLVKALLEQGNFVIVIDNFITSDPANIRKFAFNKLFRLIEWDISKPFSPEVLKRLKNLDLIYHLACPTGVPNIEKLGYEMLSTCIIGTINILDLAKRNNVRVLYTSSSEVYGDPKVFPQDENYTGNVNPIGPRSPYEEGKRAAESLVSFYVRKNKVNAVIVRLFNTYGPGMSYCDTRVIPHFFYCIKNNKALPVYGDGNQSRTFCYVDDLIKGLIAVMEYGKNGEVYNLGSDKEVSIKELAELILKVCNSQVKLRYINHPAQDHKRRLPDLRKVKSIGWKESASLKEGLKNTFKWYA